MLSLGDVGYCPQKMMKVVPCLPQEAFSNSHYGTWSVVITESQNDLGWEGP